MTQCRHEFLHQVIVIRQSKNCIRTCRQGELFRDLFKETNVFLCLWILRFFQNLTEKIHRTREDVKNLEPIVLMNSESIDISLYARGHRWDELAYQNGRFSKTA